LLQNQGSAGVALADEKGKILLPLTADVQQVQVVAACPSAESED
jgi:hypothetical protein